MSELAKTRSAPVAKLLAPDREVHGYTMTRVVSDDGVWRGEWGCSYETWLEAADQPRAKADYARLEAAVAHMNKAECVAYLVAAGKQAYVEKKLRALRSWVMIVQNDLWWPRKFVSKKGS